MRCPDSGSWRISDLDHTARWLAVEQRDKRMYPIPFVHLWAGGDLQ